MRRQLRRNINSRRSLGAPDNADGSCLVEGKAEQKGQEKGKVNTELSGGAQKKRFWIGQHGTEIRQRPETQENKGRKNLPHNAKGEKDCQQPDRFCRNFRLVGLLLGEHNGDDIACFDVLTFFYFNFFDPPENR